MEGKEGVRGKEGGRKSRKTALEDTVYLVNGTT